MSEVRTEDPKAEFRAIIRELARSIEPNVPCKCAGLSPPVTATGHKHGCPVDDATRFELASCGVV